MRRFLPLLLSLMVIWLGAFGSATRSFATGEEGGAEAPPPGVHASSEALKKELTDLIDAQLAAFRADDYAKAYTFAATEIKTLYPPKEFESMVRGAYPVIAKSSKAEFGLVFDQGDKALVNVRVIGTPEKGSRQFRYLFKKEESGWKIAGVTEIKPVGLSV